MPRKLRLHVPGGYYHVYARGNGKQDIFTDGNDRHCWEQLLREELQKHDHLIHAYCWMTNHVHMAIQAGEKPISRFLGSLLSRYAKKLNRKTGRSGHVFERRYGAILVEDDDYLLELVRYIHQNPIRAEMVSGVGDYPWSSHHAYMGNTKIPWLRTDFVLSLFSQDLGFAQDQYADYVGEKQSPTVIRQLRGGSGIDHRVLGHEEWLNNVLNHANLKPEFESLDHLIDIICQRNGVTEAQLASRSRSRANARVRAEIALRATDLGIATTTQIAQRFRRSQPVVSLAVKRLRDRAN